MTGKKGYIAVATTSLYGEDIQTKGRVSQCGVPQGSVLGPSVIFMREQ